MATDYNVKQGSKNTLGTFPESPEPPAPTLVFRIHDCWAGRISLIFGVWAALGARETIQKYGAKLPIFLNGFQGPRGRPDPENP